MTPEEIEGAGKKVDQLVAALKGATEAQDVAKEVARDGLVANVVKEFPDVIHLHDLHRHDGGTLMDHAARLREQEARVWAAMARAQTPQKMANIKLGSIEVPVPAADVFKVVAMAMIAAIACAWIWLQTAPLNDAIPAEGTRQIRTITPEQRAVLEALQRALTPTVGEPDTHTHGGVVPDGGTNADNGTH